MRCVCSCARDLYCTLDYVRAPSGGRGALVPFNLCKVRRLGNKNGYVGAHVQWFNCSTDGSDGNCCFFTDPYHLDALCYRKQLSYDCWDEGPGARCAHYQRRIEHSITHHVDTRWTWIYGAHTSALWCDFHPLVKGGFRVQCVPHTLIHI